MPSVHAVVGAPWAEGSLVHGGAVALSWRDGVTLHAGMSGYTPGESPEGSVPAYPVAPSMLEIAARKTYRSVHTITVKDLRDDAPLDVTNLSIATDEDSVFWTLRGSGPGPMFDKLMAGAQPAQVEVTIDGMVWNFAIDTLTRSRGELGATTVSFTGRSITVAASSPYQIDSNWTNDGVTTAAQTAAIANLYTGLEVVWRIEDWLIPDQIFSFTGTPLGVVRRLAEAVGAIVVSDRAAYRVTVMPRYPVMPNAWPVTPPDVQIALDAIQAETFERADRPEYDGVYVSGQQGGVVGFVRLDGRAGAVLHPLVTDLLLTEDPALRQRGEAILGASGGQARMSETLPVLTGPSEPGVLDLNQLVRVLDPAGAWHGLVRSVAVSASDLASDPRVRQVVGLERHTKLIEGTYVSPGAEPPEPFRFVGPIPDQEMVEGEAFTLDLSGYWVGGTGPVTLSMRSGTLPAGLALDGTARSISGVPLTSTTVSGVALRGTDAEANMADSNEFAFTASEVSGATVVELRTAPSPAEGADLQYQSAYATWLGGAGDGGIAYWVSSPGFSAASATYSEPKGGPYSGYTKVAFGAAGETNYTADASPGTGKMVEFKIEAGFAGRVVVGVWHTTAGKDVAQSVLTNVGNSFYYDSAGFTRWPNLEAAPTQPEEAPEFGAGDVIGVVVKSTVLNQPQVAFFKNGTLVSESVAGYMFFAYDSGSINYFASVAA